MLSNGGVPPTSSEFLSRITAIQLALGDEGLRLLLRDISNSIQAANADELMQWRNACDYLCKLSSKPCLEFCEDELKDELAPVPLQRITAQVAAGARQLLFDLTSQMERLTKWVTTFKWAVKTVPSKDPANLQMIEWLRDLKEAVTRTQYRVGELFEAFEEAARKADYDWADRQYQRTQTGETGKGLRKNKEAECKAAELAAEAPNQDKDDAK